ncbi:MAG: bacterial Ig-like domain-containing protein [Treponema sp.]|nr:bacterial Ig-like domain-containing protein [Treponema sp.]
MIILKNVLKNGVLVLFFALATLILMMACILFEEPDITSISITEYPDKTGYFVNDTFDPTGLIVTAEYSNFPPRQVTGYTLSAPDMSTAGTKTITVTFEGKTTSFDITVSSIIDVSLVSISVTRNPDKNGYYINEIFDPAGLIVTAKYSDDTTKPITGYTLSTPDMSTEGLKSITVTFEDKTTSFPIFVNPIDSSLVSINVTKNPDKTSYYVNESFDPTGIIVTAVYSDSSSKPVTGYTLSTPDMSTAGTKSITVTFEGKTTNFNITVNTITVSLVSISVSKNPDKTSYYVNETFDSAGLIVTAAYSDSTSKPITGYTLSTPDMSTAGTKSITVTFEGKTTNFNITVNTITVSLVSISVTKNPDKTSYYVNETFDPTGLIVTAAYSDSTSKPVTGYTLSAPDMSTAGTKSITVTFEGQTANFNITVNTITEASLVSISVTKNPDKIIFYINETFNPTGLIVTAAYSDNTSKPVTGYTLSTPDMSVTGVKSVIVTYQGQTAEFNITVGLMYGDIDIIIY